MMKSYCLYRRALVDIPPTCQMGSSWKSCSMSIARKKRYKLECQGLQWGAPRLNLFIVQRAKEWLHLQVVSFVKDDEFQVVRMSQESEEGKCKYSAFQKVMSFEVTRESTRSPADDRISEGDCARPDTETSSVLEGVPRDNDASVSARNCRGDWFDAGEAGNSYMEVLCDIDSGDKAKLEGIIKSASTASGALAEWRSARTQSGQAIVDWGRYHLQVMFVDRSHRVRSRLAEGLFESIAAWNGYGLILYSHSSGISAEEGERPSLGYQAEAHRLGIGRHVFRAPSTMLDRSDLDSYDLIVAVDIGVRDEVLRIAGGQSSGYASEYTNKVRLITEFASYGNISMLEDNLLEIVQPSVPQALTALEVQQTFLSQFSAWYPVVATITMCCAGLVQFLVDAYPDDLPDYDPVD